MRRPAQDRGHDREVARGNHTHNPVACETVQLRVVLGGKPARADDYMCTRSYRGQHVLPHCGGAGVVEEHIDLS